MSETGQAIHSNTDRMLHLLAKSFVHFGEWFFSGFVVLCLTLSWYFCLLLKAFTFSFIELLCKRMDL